MSQTIFGQYEIKCENGHVPKLFLRRNGKLYCGYCKRLVRRSSYRDNNCKHLKFCIQCKAQIIIKKVITY